MRRIGTGVVAVMVAVAVMGAGAKPPIAAARAVVTAYYADLAAKDYPAACSLLSRAYIKLAGRALVDAGKDKPDGGAAVAHPTPANCGRVIADVVALEKVDVAKSRAVRITKAHLAGKVATFKLGNVPGADGATTTVTAVVTDVHGAWTITAFG